MATDPRKRRVSITMTAAEWDSLAVFEDTDLTRMTSYVDPGVSYRAKSKIGKAIGSPAERYALALTEVTSKRPIILDNSATNAIQEAIRAYADWFKTGDKSNVSHLGAGNPVDPHHGEPVDGLNIHMTPHGVMVFTLREVSFAGRYPYFTFTEAEHALLLSLCCEAATVADSWNGEGCSSFSVRFQ